ncbi:ergothioneine biosynthesis protein EgtC [Nocardia terpenica]|uniref:ergothioneine biosynthesis protein EgtC n=1 Tax=Nocardia terpenica TaxID=455432 RepID=UPI0018961DEE|nr:ergothioneine biosynthesis protein EgtC [Nocardia terpenica]MBF6060596.1 ergothioneine biosynthesis protein EgtC [Nocardia terpenica]MBF6103856.1 ergothioneine biosynthesis protein EgtC [Nocardia terpenica]MBF6111770.1 ergothioneine biosynthesis protein EgtC [Nocardia terpenica]MBF6118077.1 ergothioneine biosynthesis protein EgtC [Nocardia terpenica]MBF6155197.1 ergothioneine biosynthesis protein EgtC [Nocardia terpenica]
MCRHLGYLGPAAPVGELLTRGTHSLREQGWAPRDMRGGGTINADGFGVAWWVREPGDTLRASRYRNPAPIWTDPAVDEVLPQLWSTAVVAAVRSATVGMPVERSACAPFTYGRWAFSHNGVVRDWRRVLTEVAAEFGVPSLLDAESRTDSAALWVIVRGLLETPGTAVGQAADSFRAHDPSVALARLARAVLARVPEARLNLLLSDGETLWATTVYHSLAVLVGEEAAVVASEPYDDDPRWRAVPEGRVVTVRPGSLVIASLAGDDRGGDYLEAESERARS